ncbi:hypothetical protein SCA6_008905 [Theobroma cacao]
MSMPVESFETNGNFWVRRHPLFDTCYKKIEQFVESYCFPFAAETEIGKQEEMLILHKLFHSNYNLPSRTMSVH